MTIIRGYSDLLGCLRARSIQLFGGLRLVLISLMCWMATATIVETAADERGMSIQPRRPALGQRDRDARQDALASLSQYTVKLNHRNLFGCLPERDTAAIQAEGYRETIATLLSNMEIHGTILGRVPRVVLYDRETKETVVLGLGDLVGQVEIAAIERDFVRFKLFDEEYDARVK